METQDARSLSAEAQEDLRRRVVEAVQKGLSQTEVARVFGVARGTVNRWMGMVERAGQRALKARRRGRPAVSRLKPHQAATTVRHILSGCPDQLSLPFALWTREAVQELLARKFDVEVSVWTVGRYLRAWGLTPQKPVRRAYEQNPAAVRKWLEEEYPSIREQARQWKAQIHWLDEMGLRSDHQAGRSYGRRGQTPVVCRNLALPLADQSKVHTFAGEALSRGCRGDSQGAFRVPAEVGAVDPGIGKHWGAGSSTNCGVSSRRGC